MVSLRPSYLYQKRVNPILNSSIPQKGSGYTESRASPSAILSQSPSSLPPLYFHISSLLSTCPFHILLNLPIQAASPIISPTLVATPPLSSSSLHFYQISLPIHQLLISFHFHLSQPRLSRSTFCQLPPNPPASLLSAPPPSPPPSLHFHLIHQSHFFCFHL